MRRVLPLLVLLTACGSDPKTPTTYNKVDVDVAKTSAPPVAVAPGSDRAPSRAMAEHWVIGPNVDTVVWIDLKALASTAVVKAVLPALLGQPEVGADTRKCAEAVLAHGQEALFGMDGNRRFAVVRVDGTLDGACPGGRISFDEQVGFAPGWAFYGNDDDVKAALAGKRGALPDLKVGPDELLVVSARPASHVTIDASLVMNDQRMKGVADATLPDEDTAVALEKQIDLGLRSIKPLASTLPDKSAGPAFDRLFQALTYSHTAAKEHVQFELVEGPDAQARDFGVLSTLSLYVMRKYIANAKTAEAKNSVQQIARDIVTWYESEDYVPAGAKPVPKKLFSVPATPKTVPKGMKYQSVAADWRPWDKLKFEMSAPQYYQYEVKASKDGKSADIIARGDLDGDGKTSEFLLGVAIKDSRLVINPTIKETNPDE